MATSEVISTATGLVKMASEIAGPRAPAVLVRYAVLTYLNRTSRGRPIRKVPRKAVRTAASRPPQWDADIVVPVYNDFEGISGVLDLLRREAPQFNSIVLVDDCSIDTRIAPLLSVFRDSVPNAVLIENARNLGFLRTCNRGLEASKHDVIILNTDIELPVGALGRLVDVLRAKGDIASVTPFSSNAYGAGFPDLNYDNGRPFGATTAQIDTAFQAIGPFEPIEIPRGVGFCMAMSRTAIDSVGVFDTDFGAGYGEEANFCLRAHGEGFRNLLAPNIYVYHKAGQSFGASSQRKAREGLVRLLARHPDYAGLVRTYLEGGEARAVNFAAMVALLRILSGRPVAVGQALESAALRPNLPSLSKLSHGASVRLSFNGTEHSFMFASPTIAESALKIAGLCA